MGQKKNYLIIIPFYFTISISFSLFYAIPATFASDDTSRDSQIEKNIFVEEKGPEKATEETAKETPIKDNGPAFNENGSAIGSQESLGNRSQSPDRISSGAANSNSEARGISEDQDRASNGGDLAFDGKDQTVQDIPIVLNKHVVNSITYFQTRMREKFTLWLSRSTRYISMMKEVLREYALPEDLVYISLIESGFNPNAYSRARAAGPWQFIKSTGKKYGLRIDDWVDERRNPVKSTVAAARYLKDLFDMFGSWELALASYNAGEGKIQRALVKTKGDDFWDLVDTRHIKRETKDYVPKFMAATIIARDPERYGFDVEYGSPLLYDEVIVDSPTDSSVISRASETSLEEIKALNPHLKRDMTPPGEKSYIIHIPYGKKEIFYKNFNAIPKEERLKAQRHRVRRGDTLSTISRMYGIPIDLLRELNGFSRNGALKEGEYIAVISSTVRPKKKTEYASVKGNSPKEDKDVNAGPIYRVKKGDTLWDISKRFNIPVEQIKKWNGIRRSNIIKPGDELILNQDGATG